MFWGRGDTSRLAAEEAATLAHLRRLEETGHIIALPPEKAAVAARAIESFGQWEAVFRLLNSIKNVSMLAGALLAIWWATQGQIVAWITGIAGAAS